MTDRDYGNFESVENRKTNRGYPAGGHVAGTGLEIDWQDGARGVGKHRKPPNGALLEDVIEAARIRLEYCNSAANERFRCPENDVALAALEAALTALTARKTRRLKEGVLGSHRTAGDFQAEAARKKAGSGW